MVKYIVDAAVCEKVAWKTYNERPTSKWAAHSVFIRMDYFCSFLASAFFVTSNMIGVAMKIEA